MATEPIEDLATYSRKFVWPGQLATYWGAHQETIKEWLRSGKLKGAKLSGRWQVRTSDALAFERQLFDGEPTRSITYDDRAHSLRVDWP